MTMKIETPAYCASLIENAANLINMKWRYFYDGDTYETWYENIEINPDNVKCAVQIIIDNKSIFGRSLCIYLERDGIKLYFRDYRIEKGRDLFEDSLDYTSLRLWFRRRYGLLLSCEDIHEIIDQYTKIFPYIVEARSMDNEPLPVMGCKTIIQNANILDGAAKNVGYLKRNLDYAGISKESWYKNKDGKNNQIKCAFQIALDYKELFSDFLIYVEGTLYIYDEINEKRNPWCKDMNYNGLRSWYRSHYGILLQPRELDKIIGLCIKHCIIPQHSQDVFDSMVTMHILCFEKR